MTGNVDAIFTATLALPSESREELVARLIDSLEQEEEAPLSPEWAAEVRRRIDAFKRGEMKTIPAEEVMHSLAGRDKP